MSNWRVIPKSGNDFHLAKAKGTTNIFLERALYFKRFLIILSANIFLEIKEKTLLQFERKGSGSWRAKKCRKACCLPQVWFSSGRRGNIKKLIAKCPLDKFLFYDF